MVMDLPARGLSGAGGVLGGGGGMDQGGRKSRKKRKDPNAPKRATNAYMIFWSDTHTSTARNDCSAGRLVLIRSSFA